MLAAARFPGGPPASMHFRFALLAGCALLAVAACEKSPPPFAKVDGAWQYRGSAIPDADAASFVVLSDHYAKDRAHVWYADTYRDGREYYTIAHPRVVAIADADPATFRYLARDIAKDGAAVYDEGERMRVRDVASFELMDYGFARDRHAGYCYVHEIKGSDGASFVGVDSYYAKDRARAYYCTYESDGGARRPYARIVPLADGRVASFRALEQGYAVDDRAVYYRGDVMPDAEAATFTVLGAPDNGADAKDARQRYAMGRRLPPAP